MTHVVEETDEKGRAQLRAATNSTQTSATSILYLADCAASAACFSGDVEVGATSADVAYGTAA